MNFTRFELEELFEEIKEIINFIEVSEYQNRRYRIFTGSFNTNNINFSIPNDTIAHLIGIDTNYLISTGRFKNTYSFDLLKEMCDNAYRINQMHSEGIINYERLFSPYILKKIEGFRKNIQLNCQETELICKYDPKKVYDNGMNAQKYDYIIVKKYNDGKIGILGLVNKDSYCVPMSNQIHDNFEEAKETLNRYLNKQDITIITGVNSFNIFNDYNKTARLSYNEKEEKLETILLYKDMFNCSFDIAKDYKFLLQMGKKSRNNYYEDNDLIEVIVNSIKNNKLIDTNIFNNSNLVRVAETINDYLCQNQTANTFDNQETYTQIKTALEIAKQEISLLNEKLTNLENENSSLTEEVNTLTEENNNHRENNKKILELLNKKPRI